MTITATPPVDWIGLGYTEGECWDVVRDAFAQRAGITLPDGYYEAQQRFTVVHDVRSGEPFTPQPWDVVMIRSNPRSFLILHCGLCIDGERFLHAWGDSGVVISSITADEWKSRIAGYLRLKNA